MRKYLSIILLMVSAAFTYLALNHLVQLTNKNEKLIFQKFSVGDDDNPYARIEQEFMMLRDPKKNRIPPNIFKREHEFAKNLPKRIKGILYKDNQGNETKALTWTSRGPKNVGGRTRALGIDIRTTEPPNVTIIAGGVSGGLWRSTDDGATWSLRTSPSQIHSVTCLAQDIRRGQENNWYAGSGERAGNSTSGGGAVFCGDGIFKSFDNGLTWTQLASTVSGTPQTYDNVFDFVHNIAVSQTTGSVFAAASNTIKRSTNGGTTWSTVLGQFTHIGFTDVQITSTGVVYATLDSTATTPGIWRSTDDGDTWTNITPAGFPVECYRTVIGITPNTSIDCDIWFLGETPGEGTLEHSLWKYNSKGVGSWINRSANIPSIGGLVGDFSSQNSFDLVIKSKHLTQGNPIFTFAHTLSTGLYGEEPIHAVDVDSDGDLDVLCSANHRIEWKENDGNENFTTRTISGVAMGISSIYGVDVDSDGDMDVISASWSDGKIAWHENDGNENFESHTITTNVSIPRSIFAVDMDSDGDMDVVSASQSDDKIAWYQNDGNQSFTQHTITTVADGAFSVYAVDVDSDGDMDVLSASMSDNKIAWYENDGNQNFTQHAITTSAVGARSVYAVDIDSDGDMDALSASFSDNKIAWYENDGNENFFSHTISAIAEGAFSVYAVDVDSDGDMDALSASFSDNKIAWYENDGTFPPDFIPHTITTNAEDAITVYAVDLDCDGDMDVLSASNVDEKVAWYENTSVVKDFVLIGGTNLYRSTDGFETSAATTWIGGYSPSNTNYVQYPNQHCDQHALSFLPGSNKIIYSGHDGGISKTNNITTSFGGNEPVVWTSLNNNYHTTQFYSISLAPESGSNVMMGGMQDNGCWFGNGAGSSDWEFYWSGDGTFVEVGPLADDRVYPASQNGRVLRQNRAGTTTSTVVFTPTGSYNQLFVNPVAIDPNNSSLYYYAAGNMSINSGIWRNSDLKNATTTTGWTWLTNTGVVPLAQVTAIGVSTSNDANIVYYGTNSGPIRRIDNANTGFAVVVTNIKGTLPDAYVSCIAVDPTNSNNALLAFSNYNTVSLWYTTDGGTNWIDVEGNLAGADGPSIRWATIFNVDAVPHYFLATSVGIFFTNLLNGSSTVWTQEAVSEIGNVVCTMLDWRSSDGTLAVATHGRGVFTTSISAALPVELSSLLSTQYGLSQNYPNPFNPITKISYSIPEVSFVNLKVYDLLGNEIVLLVNEEKPIGTYEVEFDASELSSGTYFYRLQADDYISTKKMVLLK